MDLVCDVRPNDQEKRIRPTGDRPGGLNALRRQERSNSFTPALKKLLEVSRRHMFEEHILSAFAQVTRSMKTLVGSGHWLETQTNDRQKEGRGLEFSAKPFPTCNRQS